MAEKNGPRWRTILPMMGACVLVSIGATWQLLGQQERTNARIQQIILEDIRAIRDDLREIRNRLDSIVAKG